MTIDQLYQTVISLTARVPDAFKRSDYQQMARMAYVNEDARGLHSLQRQLVMMPVVGIREPRKAHIPAQQKLAPMELPSGMPSPSVYNYFSNFNSPLNNLQPKLAQSFPLYSNFGAYNKHLV